MKSQLIGNALGSSSEKLNIAFNSDNKELNIQFFSDVSVISPGTRVITNGDGASIEINPSI